MLISEWIDQSFACQLIGEPFSAAPCLGDLPTSKSQLVELVLSYLFRLAEIPAALRALEELPLQEIFDWCKISAKKDPVYTLLSLPTIPKLCTYQTKNVGGPEESIEGVFPGFQDMTDPVMRNQTEGGGIGICLMTRGEEIYVSGDDPGYYYSRTDRKAISFYFTAFFSVQVFESRAVYRSIDRTSSQLISSIPNERRDGKTIKHSYSHFVSYNLPSQIKGSISGELLKPAIRDAFDPGEIQRLSSTSSQSESLTIKSDNKMNWLDFNYLDLINIVSEAMKKDLYTWLTLPATNTFETCAYWRKHVPSWLEFPPPPELQSWFPEPVKLKKALQCHSVEHDPYLCPDIGLPKRGSLLHQIIELAENLRDYCDSFPLANKTQMTTPQQKAVLDLGEALSERNTPYEVAHAIAEARAFFEQTTSFKDLEEYRWAHRMVSLHFIPLFKSTLSEGKNPIRVVLAVQAEAQRRLNEESSHRGWDLKIQYTLPNRRTTKTFDFRAEPYALTHTLLLACARNFDPKTPHRGFTSARVLFAFERDKAPRFVFDGIPLISYLREVPNKDPISVEINRPRESSRYRKLSDDMREDQAMLFNMMHQILGEWSYSEYLEAHRIPSSLIGLIGSYVFFDPKTLLPAKFAISQRSTDVERQERVEAMRTWLEFRKRWAPQEDLSEKTAEHVDSKELQTESSVQKTPLVPFDPPPQDRAPRISCCQSLYNRIAEFFAS